MFESLFEIRPIMHCHCQHFPCTTDAQVQVQQGNDVIIAPHVSGVSKDGQAWHATSGAVRYRVDGRQSTSSGRTA